jgi:hypothetical protein
MPEYVAAAWTPPRPVVDPALGERVRAADRAASRPPQIRVLDASTRAPRVAAAAGAPAPAEEPEDGLPVNWFPSLARRREKEEPPPGGASAEESNDSGGLPTEWFPRKRPRVESDR